LNYKKKKRKKTSCNKGEKQEKENWIMGAELKIGRDLRKVCEGERRVEFYLKLEQTGTSTIYQNFPVQAVLYSE
jgi:hypothetical protein